MMIYILFTIFTLSIGSLLNVVTVRLPGMLQTDCDYNLFWPRSFCPICKTQIHAKHNIPLISFFWLRRKCAYCKGLISWRYPAIELISCLVAYIALWKFGVNLTFFCSLLFIWITIAIIVIDYEHQIIPDILALPLLWIGLLANTQNIFVDISSAVFGAVAAYIFLWIFIKLFYLITGKIGMGHGDFKLFAAFGAWFGLEQLPKILFLAALIGTIGGLIWLYAHKKKLDSRIPFGPFLCLSGLMHLFLDLTG